MTGVAALIVTHNAHTWLEQTLASVVAQERPADTIIVVDDHSTDGTRGVVMAMAPSAVLLESRSVAGDALTRTAHNFVQGATHARTLGYDIVVLGDHDDVWHRGRIAHQAAVLERDQVLAMVAGDGVLTYDDGGGAGAPARLREAFPVDPAFATWPAEVQFAYALGHSVATGGASAIRVSRLAPALVPPLGWLHDRWWSLASCVVGGMLVDPQAVIDYRVREGQQVGIDRGRQARSGAGRAVGSLGRSPQLLSRARDLRAGLMPLATSGTMQQALSLRNIARAAR
jgi:glycosyltransferase involved in cell wall biosynthesis